MSVVPAQPLQTCAVLLTALAALWFGACSDDDASGGAGSLAGLGIDDGASQGESRSKLVKAGEAADLTLKTGARLSLPEGASDDDVEIAMKRPRDEEALPLLKMVKSEYKAVSAPYVITPHGKSFNKDIELSLPVGKGKSDRLEVAYLEDEDDTNWKIHGKPRVTKGSAQVSLKHFSVYVLLERVGDEPTLDGGSGSEEGGVDVESDAGPASADGGTSRPDATVGGGSFTERFTARLDECSLLSQPGMLAHSFDLETTHQQCAANCLFDAHCDDLRAELCEGSSSATDAYTSCVLKCYSFSVVECLSIAGVTMLVPSCDDVPQCMDGSDEANCPDEAFFVCSTPGEGRVPVNGRCDGFEDCLDGSDEQGCPPGTLFTCDSGETITAAYECDGEEDCNDGSDEARCPTFQCRDGAQLVPQAVVCDMTRDCSDGSDEDQGCLKLSCQPRGESSADF